jgi:hypothetical protein
MKTIQHYINSVQNRTMKYVNQRKSWTTDRKILVIESDDWGSIRMPSKEVFNTLLKKGISVDKCAFNKFDSLASKDDMELLFSLLLKYRDKNNNPAVITANSVIANPDFEKIKQSDYTEYHYELFTETLKRKTDNNFDLWKDGINNKVFYPQFHGREHLNINRWLKFLRSGSKELLTAFEHEVFGISTTISKENNPSFMAALSVDDERDYESHSKIIEEGYRLFTDLFGYDSKSFIAPNYTWHPMHEDVLSKLGVKYLQGTSAQHVPLQGNKQKNKYHYTGEFNSNNQIYMVRNCIFEPSSNPSKNWVTSCFKEINRAFENKRPAIICSHRVNFIGSIFPGNRDENLKLLEDLLKKVLKKWPDVEFMTSDQLGELIEKGI